MTDTTTSINIADLNHDQLKALEKQLRERKNAVKRGEKYQSFQPVYGQYRQAVIDAKTASDSKKNLWKQLKALGFGAKKVKPFKSGSSPKKK